MCTNWISRKNVWTLSFFLLLLFVSNRSQAQYCAAATTNVAITPTLSAQLSASYSSGKRAFNFVATPGCTYVFETCSQSTADTYLRLYSTGTGGTVLATADDNCGTQSRITWTCVTAGTYSVLLTNYSCANLNTATRLNYYISSCASISAPSNDLVCSATAISCGQTLSGTTVNATNSGTGENGTCNVTQSQPGVWYSVTGNGSVFTASLCGTVWDSKISVFSGTCSALTCVGGIDDNGPACTSSTSASYSWNSVNGTTYFILVHGYSSTAAFSIALNCSTPNPTSATASTNPVCQGSSVTLSAGGAAGTVYWYSGSCGGTQIGTGTTLTVTPSATTTYYAKNFSNGSFSPGCASVTVTMLSAPPVNAGNDQSLCAGTTVSLNGTAGTSSGAPSVGFLNDFATSNWNFINTTSNGNINTSSAPASITITGGDDGSGSSGTSEWTITVLNSGTISFNWSYSTLDWDPSYDYPQIGNNGAFTVPAGFDNSGTGAINQSGTSGNITVVAGTVFVLQMFTADNTLGAGTFTVSNFTFTPTLASNSGYTFQWSPSAGLSQTNIGNPVFSGSSSQTYTLTVTNSNGCSASDQVNVTVNPIPTAPTAAAQTICYGASAMVTSNSANTQWYNSAAGSNALGSGNTFSTPSLTANAVYYMQQSVNGCVSPMGQAIVNVNPYPNNITPINANATGCNVYSPNNWVYLVCAANTMLAGVFDASGGNNLNNTNASVQILPSVQTFNNMPYLQRVTTITPSSNGPAEVELYFTDAEFQALQAADPALMSIGQLVVTKFAGPGLTGASTLIVPSQISTGVPFAGVNTIRISVSGFSTFVIHRNLNNSPLAIHLAAFDAMRRGDEVLLTWTTASEENNDFFTIERSANGVYFEPVILVDGAGNSNSTLNYSTLDTQPLGGWSYYRLKQTDYDGTSTYSQVRAVYFEGENSGEFLPAPNPAIAGTIVDLGTPTTVSVYDAQGNLVSPEQNTRFIHTSGFAAGIYFIRASDGTTKTMVVL
jgi:hypothetical protein